MSHSACVDSAVCKGAPDRLEESGCLFWLSALLASVTVWLYVPVLKAGFILYDDPIYASENPIVRMGLTWAGIKWSLTTVFYFYHPLTWLSLMVDTELFGPHPVGFHLTNICIHAANVILLFVWLKCATHALFRSFCVALLFAIHPLNVETVAWISERKGLLSACGFLATLLFYTRYTECPSNWRYLVAIASFFCSLLAKSTFVTLPAVLFLVDFWPLRRFQNLTAGIVDGDFKRSRQLFALVLEKVPFMALSLIFFNLGRLLF